MNSNFVSVKDFKEYAHSVLPRNSLDYYRSGAAEQLTLALNKQSFNKYVELYILLLHALNCNCYVIGKLHF